MKILGGLLFVALFFQFRRHQPAVVVENEKQNILIKDVENPLLALIEGTSKKEVVLTTDNGHIDKQEQGGFMIIPARVGLAKINVCRIVKNDTVVVGTKEFRIHPLPEPVAFIAGLSGGTIKKKTLINMGGIIARINCGEFDFPVTISTYTLISMRDNVTTGTCKNTGPRFNEGSLALLNRLETGDRLIVCGIVSSGPADKWLSRPIEFIIEE